MIRRVHFQNYRALVDVTIDLDGLTVLVGPNGAGKTTILRALTFLLAGAWGPSVSRLTVPEDYTNLDASLPMWIQADYEPLLSHTDAIGNDHEIKSISFRCQPYKRATGDNVPGDLRDIYAPLGKDGEVPVVCTNGPRKGHKPQFGPLRMTGALRDQSRVLAITDERSVYSQRAGRRGSVLASLLDAAQRSFLRDEDGVRTQFGEKYQNAVEVLRTDELKEVESTVQETARRMLGFAGTDDGLKLEFGFADPARPHSALRLMSRQGDLLLPAESLGQGEQSAIVIGMFEALRQRGTNLNTILLEEPEMYLHPQAQRYFKNLLLDLVDEQQAQVVISTHSPIFADMTRFRSIRIVRRTSDTGTFVQRIDSEEDLEFLDHQLEAAKLTQYFDTESSELLFAERVLLVEGHGDRLAALEVAKKLNVDLDAEGLSIIDCGGKNAIPFYARSCRALGIPCVILHDEDIYGGENLASWQEESNQKAPDQNETVREAASPETEIYLVNETLESALGVGRNASNKPMRVLEVVESTEVAALPEPLVDAVKSLAGISESQAALPAEDDESRSSDGPQTVEPAD